MIAIRRLAGLSLSLAVCLAGCSSTRVTDPTVDSTAGPWWDVDQAEILVWHSQVPSFGQEMALEGSGLVAHEGKLLAASEKYAHLLRIDPATLEVQTLALGLPQYAEIEGVTVDGSEILICDEANAAVWAVELPPGEGASSGTLDVRRLELAGLELKGGKLGLEGITVGEGENPTIFLALERQGSRKTECSASIFQLHRSENRLVARGQPLVIPLEDCNWRLTGLQSWNGHLLALKTRFPGERYQVVVIDRETGSLSVVLDMTELLIEVEKEGWGNNIEGVTVTEDGSLWLLSDNAMTDKAETRTPGPAGDRTLLMRVPPLGLPRPN